LVALIILSYCEHNHKKSQKLRVPIQIQQSPGRSSWIGDGLHARSSRFSRGFAFDEKETHRRNNGGMALLAEPNAPLKDDKG
jgi:hypothetical protein